MSTIEIIDDCCENCQVCNDRPAEIFNVQGSYCVGCWQIATYPDI